jgi:hypothetical protein
MKRLFTEGFTVMDIAEPLYSFDAQKNALDAAQLCREHGTEIIGVRQRGVVSGFAIRHDLTAGTCGEHMRDFAEDSILSGSSSYRETIFALDRSQYCFVSILGQVVAYVTRADMEKPPVRMWLFGMITIVEMFMTRTIKSKFPNETWQSEISENRLAKARILQEERQRMNQRAALLDCLHLVDKGHILIKDPVLREDSGFGSMREAKRALKAFESLRNNLAHTHDIVTHDWELIVAMAGRLDRIMTRIGDE